MKKKQAKSASMVSLDRETCSAIVGWLSELAVYKLRAGVGPQSIVEGPLKEAAYVALICSVTKP